MSSSARTDPFNWVSPKISVGEFPGRGKGMVATTPIAAGERVLMYGGVVITLEEFSALSPEMQNYPFQIDLDLFLTPMEGVTFGPSEYLNHSCDPTCGFESEVRLVAMRELLPGEEITIDYAMCLSHATEPMQCMCGAARCRGVTTRDDWKLPELRQRLEPFFQPYLRKLIAREKSEAASR